VNVKMRHWQAVGRRAVKQAWQNGNFWYAVALLSLLPIWFGPTMLADSVVVDTLFVIDISESMNVQDVDYPKPNTARLTLAKLAVREGMASLPCGSRVSVGLLAGDQTVILFEPLEVCRHYPALENVIMRVDTNMRWIGDSWIVKGFASAIKEANKRNLNVVMVTDADQMPHRLAPRITDLVDYQGKVKGILWGVGGEAPQPVPKLNQQHQVIGYWTREEAVVEGNYPNLLAYVKTLSPGESAPEGVLDEVQEHLSAFNPNLIKTLADVLTIDFAKVHAPKDAVHSIKNNTDLQVKAIAQRDARWIFAMLALLFVLMAWFWQHLTPFRK
jgi:mxaL protein